MQLAHSSIGLDQITSSGIRITHATLDEFAKTVQRGRVEDSDL